MKTTIKQQRTDSTIFDDTKVLINDDGMYLTQIRDNREHTIFLSRKATSELLCLADIEMELVECES
jgi:hypothetical protein